MSDEIPPPVNPTPHSPTLALPVTGTEPPPAPESTTPIPPAGGSSRKAWLWAGGIVLLALATAAFVFWLATRNNPSSTAAATPVVATSSPTSSAKSSSTAFPSPTATPAPSNTPAPTAAPPPKTPTEQAALLFPGSGSACGSTGNYANCPVTPQLTDAANQWRSNHAPSSPEPLCRCPVDYVNPSYTHDDSLLPVGDQGNPQDAAVAVRLFFDATHYEDMVVLFAEQPSGAWLAFDTYCDSRSNSLGAAGAQVCTVHS